MQVFQSRDDHGRLVERIRLSPRERQVLRQVATGASNKAIAHTVGMALSTVKGHVSSLAHALGCDNRVGLARWAILNPDVFAGLAVETSLHPPGCLCGERFCAALRLLDKAA